MSELVNFSENLNETGKNIYKTNQHFRRLANVMEHPEFRDFYNQYMQDWESVKMIMMFMKIYEAVEKHSKVELTPFQKISVVKEVIEDGELRQKVCQGIFDWIKTPKDIKMLSFTDEKSIVGSPS